MNRSLYEILEARVQQDRSDIDREDPTVYLGVRLEYSGRDCDGPHRAEARRVLVTDEELPFVLAHHFGANGWHLDKDDRSHELSNSDILYFSRHDKTDEGYRSLYATVFRYAETNG